MSVLDSSGAIDFLLGAGAADEVAGLLGETPPPAAPELLVFETLAVLRRDVLRGTLDPERARGAVDDLGDLGVELFPAMPLRVRAWELRSDFTAADALFVALSEALDEPLATSDRGLAASARDLVGIDVIELGA